MFSAKEAREMEEAPHVLTWYEKIYLIWIRGRINEKIKKAINLKRHSIYININNVKLGIRISDAVEAYYISLGYRVDINICKCHVGIYIYW